MQVKFEADCDTGTKNFTILPLGFVSGSKQSRQEGERGAKAKFTPTKEARQGFRPPKSMLVLLQSALGP